MCRGSKILANYAVGYNNIDLIAATQHGIIVTNTPDVLTESTADLTWALMLAVARRVAEGDALCTVGGLVRLGSDTNAGSGCLTERCWGLSAWDVSARPWRAAPPVSTCASVTALGTAPTPDRLVASWERRAFSDLLRESDFVSASMCRSPPDTQHLIGSRPVGPHETDGLLDQYVSRAGRG